MANIIYGGVVLKARGSIAGVTYSRCVYSETARAKPRPLLAPTPTRSAVRRRMQYWVSYWRNLTPTQQDNWALYGATVILTNSLGNNYSLTGQQAWLRSQLPFDDITQFRSIERPTADGQAAIPTITLAFVGNDLEITSIVPTPDPEDTLIVSIYRPQCRTRSAPIGPVLGRAIMYPPAAPPITLWQNYKNILYAGTHAIAFVDTRYIDFYYRPSSINRLSLEFDAT